MSYLSDIDPTPDDYAPMPRRWRVALTAGSVAGCLMWLCMIGAAVAAVAVVLGLLR